MSLTKVGSPPPPDTPYTLLGPTTDGQRNIFTQLSRFLEARGLGALFTITAEGAPSGWLWNQLVEGIDTEAELLIAIEDTSVFKKRFGVILDLRERRLAGENVQVPTVDQLLEYEARVASVMRSAGMPTHLYATPNAVHKYLTLGLSPAEIEARVDQVWNTVHGAAPEILAEFRSIIGTNSDEMLAAFILDPETTGVELERKVRQATVGGIADQFNLGISDNQRDAIAELPITAAGAAERFANINSSAGMFTEGYGEVDDLTAEGEGIAVEFFGDARSQTAMEQRLARRKGLERAASGGAQAQAGGVAGLR